MTEQIDIDRFIELMTEIPHIDVRSPIEYNHAHIPGCRNVALFSDDERAEIGRCYNHKGQRAATILGEQFANPRIPYYLEETKSILLDDTVLVLCARGGLRSQRFAQLLENEGLNVYRLKGGYKSYRRYVLNSFEQEFSLVILGGGTGCGKTEILKSLEHRGEQVLDLEDLAHHKGSAFGSIGLRSQPSTEYFQNCLSEKLRSLNPDRRIWVEDESLNIGKVIIPEPFYRQMKEAPQVLVDMDRDSRILRLCGEYGRLGTTPLAESLTRIQKRLGNEDYRKALDSLNRGQLEDAATIVLRYYDKCYDYSLSKKKRNTLAKIQIVDGNTRSAAEDIMGIF